MSVRRTKLSTHLTAEGHKTTLIDVNDGIPPKVLLPIVPSTSFCHAAKTSIRLGTETGDPTYKCLQYAST